jgi:hypothetical protein
MALINKVWRESQFVPPGAEPGLNSGREFMENVQNAAVRDVARARFAYPSPEQPGLKTYVNRPEHTVGVRVASGDLLFPDIVVLDTATTEVQMLGEVETARSLLAADVTDKWQAFAGVGLLFLFVPFSQVERARRLLRPLDLRLGGLRTWKHNLGQDAIDVVELPV